LLKLKKWGFKNKSIFEIEKINIDNSLQFLKLKNQEFKNKSIFEIKKIKNH
jgi:hypothetical protein